MYSRNSMFLVVSMRPSKDCLPRPASGSKSEMELRSAGFVFQGRGQGCVFLSGWPEGWFLHNALGTNVAKASAVKLQLCDPQRRVVAVVTGRFAEDHYECRMDPPNDEIYIRH